MDDLSPSSSGYAYPLDMSATSVTSSTSVGEVGVDMKREQKRRPKPKDQSSLICGVCGDKALGYNFDAITCESCKAFFRRNALKTKSFACSFDGNCTLDTHTRKFCAGCRLRKCFDVGMKKEWILTDVQLQKRRRRNSSKQSTNQYQSEYEDDFNSTGESVCCGNGEESAGSAADSPATDPWKSPQVEQMKSPLSNTETTVKSPALFDCSLTISPLNEIECSPIIKQEKDGFDEDDLITPLTPEIWSKVKNIQTTYESVFNVPYNADQERKLKSDVRSADDLFNMTDVFIKRLIKFSKSIPEFRSLKQEDQIALLKGGVMEIMYLRSASSFDDRRRSWTYTTTTSGQSEKLKAEVLHSLGDQGFSSHISFVKGLHQLCGNDPIIMILLFVIELFSPDRPNLNNKKLVSKVQEMFSLWMKLYVESQFPLKEARVLYPKLLMKLTDVRTLGEQSSQMAAKLDISRMEPLLVEVFNLKS